MTTDTHGKCGAGVSPRRRPLPALLVLAATLVLPGLCRATPFVPASDAVVLEQRPDSGDSAARDARRLHRQLAASPDNLDLALQAAAQDMAIGRRQADPRYLGRAEAALAHWPDGPDTPPQVLLLRAVLRQSLHDFAGARAALARLLAAAPRTPQAYLTRASIETVQAAYPAALEDCGKLALLDTGAASMICTASVSSLTGHARLAQAALGVALRNAAEDAVPVRLWAETLAAEIAVRLDDAASAEAHFAAALRLDPQDSYLLGAYADFLLDQHRAAEAAALLRGFTRNDPLLLRLALAEQVLGLAEFDTHAADLQARFDTARLRGETVHRREEARFTLALLHRPAEALALAQANWLVQREPADARILIEAAIAAGAPEQAEAALGWMRTNHVEDAALTRLLAPARHAAN